MATSRKRACIPFEKDAKETRDIERKMEKREEGGEERRGEIERRGEKITFFLWHVEPFSLLVTPIIFAQFYKICRSVSASVVLFLSLCFSLPPLFSSACCRQALLLDYMLATLFAFLYILLSGACACRERPATLVMS